LLPVPHQILILTGAVVWNLVAVQCFECEFCLQSDWPVHQLWPPPCEPKKRTTLDVVFFHGLQFTVNCTGDAWKSTWTQRGDDGVCWPEDWLPSDLGDDGVRIISVSYNAHVLTSPYDHVSDIASYLFPSLMDRRYESPLLYLAM
jgi:hypothetical protein